MELKVRQAKDFRTFTSSEYYKLNEEKMWFEITEDGQVVKCNMTDEEFEVPNTGLSNINYELIGSIVLVISGLGLMIYGIKKRK